MKRFSPLVVIIVAAAAAFALLRNSDEPGRDPAEEWKPVQPT